MDSNTELFTPESMRLVGLAIFRALGASREEATIVVNELIEASLMGIDSHRVMRYVQYAEEIWSGQIKPGAVVEIVRQTPSTAIVDCGFNFGAVSAQRMIPIVCGKAAQNGIGCVVGRNSNHVGRLGSWVERIASYNRRAPSCLLACCSATRGTGWRCWWKCWARVWLALRSARKWRSAMGCA